MAPRRPTYEELEETVRQLKDELGQKREDDKVQKVAKALGLTRAQSTLVCILYKAPGAVRAEILSKTCARPTDWNETGNTNTAAVHIGRIRAKVGDAFIDTYRTFGYGLSYQGRAKVAGILK